MSSPLDSAPLDPKTGEHPSAVVTGQTYPEHPALPWDVSLIQTSPSSSAHFTRPHIPPNRTTHDGRVGISLKGGVSFTYYAPERLTTHFVDSPAGATILANPNGFLVSDDLFHQTAPYDPPNGNLAHRAICDATSQFPGASATSPRPCTQDPSADCYDFTVVTGWEWTDSNQDQWIRLYGTPITVKVTNPKTASAQIVSVTRTGSPVEGTTFQFKDMLEPMITGDGRLLVMRVGNSSIRWWNEHHNSESGGYITGNYNIVYSVYGSDAPACDVTRWDVFKPIAHAPYDTANNLTTRYGFAMQPFRDMEGNTIPDDINLPATYPWIDRQGRNLFFFTIGRNLYFEDANGIQKQYTTSCVVSGCNNNPSSAAEIDAFESSDQTKGLTVMGLWTNGKAVMLDSVLNNTEFGLGHWDNAHRNVTLYSDAPTEVRVGSGRGNTTNGAPPGFVINTTFVDSTENVFNYSWKMRPHTPRDVVWTMSKGTVSAEVAFDDYVNPKGMIFADMQVALHTVQPNGGYDWRIQDGLVISTQAGTNSGFTGTVKLQNAATAKAGAWRIPPYGVLEGAGRVEPVALGGIHGKGLWLRSTSALRFDVPAQTANDPTLANWFVGLFVDPRFSDDATRRELFSFPDTSGLEIEGLHSLLIRGTAGGIQKRIDIPTALQVARGEWFHVGAVVENDGASIRVFWDGYELGSWSSSSTLRLFQLAPLPGAVRLGDSPAASTGVRGWVDEFKLYSQAPNDEVLCNHARGTLAAIDVGGTGTWVTRANAYPATEHARLAASMGSPGVGGPVSTRYACVVDYTNELGVSERTLPAVATSVRPYVNFPEGPLETGSPRPESQSNGFCLNCHRSTGLRGLSLEALALDTTVTMENDPRRQPMQAPRLMFGTITGAALAPIVDPRFPFQAPQGGEPLDPWLNPPIP